MPQRGVPKIQNLEPYPELREWDLCGKVGAGIGVSREVLGSPGMDGADQAPFSGQHLETDSSTSPRFLEGYAHLS